jgi:SAM-dependent methyltransferase
MSKPNRPFLDFYKEHSVIPTHLEISDKKEFFAQRNFLFESLGVPPNFLDGSKILEFGSGTGQKAEHLLSLKPKVYVAVDNNPESLKSTQAVISSSKFSGIARVANADFFHYQDSEKYDFILAELVLPTQQHPQLLLKKLIEMLEVGGILVITCADSISILSENLRRAIVKRLDFVSNDISDSAKRIIDFFESDLDFLIGMNRRRVDWAIDQMIKPTIGPQLSIPEAIEGFNNSAKFYGSSPRFVEDLRWYKSPDIKLVSLNTIAEKNYWRKCHNFLDYRHEYQTLEEQVNYQLKDLSDKIYKVVQESEWSSESFASLNENCKNITTLISANCPETAGSIASFIDFWETGDPRALKLFRPWWGRGTQYISVTRS